MWKGGVPDHGDRRERDGEENREKTAHKRNTSPKPSPAKITRANYLKFTQSGAEVLEVHARTRVEPGERSSAPVKKGGRGLGADEVL